MKKRLILLCLIFLTAAAAFSVPSYGEKRIGLGLGAPNTVLVFQADPYDVKIGYDFTEGKEYFFLNGSYMVISSRPVNEIFSASLGIGLFGKISFAEEKDDDNAFIGGMNIPVSFEMGLVDGFFEIFALIAPAVELFPKPVFTTRAISWWLGFTILLD